MKRLGILLYGLASYGIFFGTFVYAIGFIGGIVVPRTIDGEPRVPLGAAIAIDLGLLGLFAIQHSVMARPGFKRRLTRLIPVAAERSTYVLASSLALILLFWQWQPLGGTVWEVGSTAGRVALWALFAGGWATVLVSTFLIDHFDLFGLRQAILYARGKEYTALPFRTPGPYKFVRHPLYVGWILVFWATPTMGVAHLVFAIATTAYILVAIRLEESDLADFHPDYAEYRAQVPMLVPRPGRMWRRPRSAETAGATAESADPLTMAR